MRNLLLLVTFTAAIPFFAACSGESGVEISSGTSFEPAGKPGNGRIDARPGRGTPGGSTSTGSSGSAGGSNGGTGTGSGGTAGGSSGSTGTGSGGTASGSSGSTGSSGGGTSGSSGSGSGSPSPIDVGAGPSVAGHSNMLPPPEVDDRYCSASCKLEAQCGYSPKDCVDSCRVHNRHVRDEFLAQEAACLESATCWEPQGACAHKAAKTLKCQYESEPMYQKCVTKRSQCSAQIRTGECARYLFLESKERTDVDACLSQPCDAVGKCIDQVLARTMKK